MALELLAQLIVNGLGLGMLYVLIVLGIDVILRGTKILNFAHGQIYMLGAYSFFIFYTAFRFYFGFALVLSALAMGLLGALSYLAIFDTVQRRFIVGATFSYRLLISAMASVGLMMILEQGTLLVFGTAERGIPPIFPQLINVGGIILPLARLVIILLSLSICGGLYGLMFKTKLGKAMRAVAFDAEMSSLLGINTFRIYLVSFVVGCALAGIAGAIVAPVFSVTPDMGHAVVFTAFLVMIVGGIGSYKGAVLGGIMIGLVLSFGYQFLGGLAQVFLFIFVIVILIFRPGGILGEVHE
jgi:branched-chain amino acid transport system permease protein